MSEEIDHKKCSKCGLVKSVLHFGKTKGVYRSQCKECRKNERQSSESKKEWYARNKDHCSEKSKKYYNINRAKIEEYKKEWRKINEDRLSKEARIKYLENKKTILQKSKERYMKIKNDPERKEKRKEYEKKWKEKNKHVVAWRRLLYRIFKSEEENASTKDILGYSSEELRVHIESRWTDGMSWDNYGKWHIDHIIPVSLFPENTHPAVVNALSNLRPLWAVTTEINGKVYEGNLNRIIDKESKKISVSDRPLTLFIDIDGCLITHNGDLNTQLIRNPTLLPGVKEKFAEWDCRGYKIILTTGRKESCRSITEKQINELGLFYDQLIMGISSGVRVIINDLKPDSKIATAVAINVSRNTGLDNIDLEQASKSQTLAMLHGVNLNIIQ